MHLDYIPFNPVEHGKELVGSAHPTRAAGAPRQTSSRYCDDPSAPGAPARAARTKESMGSARPPLAVKGKIKIEVKGPLADTENRKQKTGNRKSYRLSCRKQKTGKAKQSPPCASISPGADSGAPRVACNCSSACCWPGQPCWHISRLKTTTSSPSMTTCTSLRIPWSVPGSPGRG